MIRKLEWDSNFFNQEIYQCDSSDLENTHQLPNNSFLQVKLPFSNREEISKLELNGFFLVDYHLEYEIDITSIIENTNIYDICIELGKLEDNYNCFPKMFVNNSRFSVYANNKLVEQFYAKWIENSILGIFDNELLVYTSLDNVIGISTIKYLSEVSVRIGLFAVSQNYQGRGFGKIILSTLLTRLNRNGIRKVFIATQGKNTSAQRLYEKNGFKLASKEAIYCKKIGEN